MDAVEPSTKNAYGSETNKPYTYSLCPRRLDCQYLEIVFIIEMLPLIIKGSIVASYM